MTATIQTSAYNSIGSHRSSRTSYTYSVVVNAEDGNYQEFEIEAASDAEAHSKANAIAQSSMIDITYVEVYRIG